MNYTNIFKNAQALLVSVGNSYSEDQLIYIFLDKYYQGGNNYSQIDSHQAELRRKKVFTGQ